MGNKEETESLHKKLPAEEIGLKAERSCTNCFFLILFFLFWALMGFVAYVGFQKGDLDRLRYGVDYQGNVCGKTPTKATGQAAKDWGQYNKLWYPFYYDISTGTFQYKDAFDLGVCVKECPAPNDNPLYPTQVDTYGPAIEGDTSSAPQASYPVQYASVYQFYRCIPQAFACMNITTTASARDECENKTTKSGILGKLGQFSKAAQFGDRAFDELQKFWWVVLVCAGIAVVVCFLWLFILRRLVKPVVVFSMVAVFVALAVLGYLFFLKKQQIEAKTPDDKAVNYYFAAAIACWVVDFLYLCVMIFLGKDVMVACDIIEEAAKVPLKMPTMVLVPPVIFLCILPFLFFAIFVAANIYTAAKTITGEVPSYHGNNNTVTFRKFESENWRTYANLFNLFMFLWSMGFINAIGFMIVAFCAVFWYWSNPGDDKQPQAGVLKAAALTFRYHLGTLALGSMIIAIIQIIRFCLWMLERHLKKIGENNDGIKCIIRCAQCCMLCFERIIKFINKNAYIVTSMTGEGFMDAAKHALHLLMANALSVGAVTIIGEYVMIIGKIMITAMCCVIAWAILQKQEGGMEGATNGVLVIVVVGIIAYFIACIFLNVFGVCIDAVLLSYCYDLEAHDGDTKPYYFPSDLAQHVKRAKDRNERKGNRDSKAEPLN